MASPLDDKSVDSVISPVQDNTQRTLKVMLFSPVVPVYLIRLRQSRHIQLIGIGSRYLRDFFKQLE